MSSKFIFGLVSLIFLKGVTTRFLDMTHKLHNGMPVYPTLLTPFQMTVPHNGMQPGGFWLQSEDICTSVHIGTHMDAPCHFAQGTLCIDEIPFERFMLPAVVVDITEKANNDSDTSLTVEDLEDWENIYGKIPNGSIVVLRTGWGKYWTDKEKFLGTTANDTTKLHFPGISPDAAQWLVNNTDIYAVAVETISIDCGQSTKYEAHTILLSENIYAIENMANVDQLPVEGATIFAMPINIRDGSGAPARVSAKLPDSI